MAAVDGFPDPAGGRSGEVRVRVARDPGHRRYPVSEGPDVAELELVEAVQVDLLGAERSGMLDKHRTGKSTGR
jgi:hypothetical protein